MLAAGGERAAPARRPQIPGYQVAGKTGTARKPPYEHRPYQYIASFAGFAPAGRSPAGGDRGARRAAAAAIYGADVAAPVFQQIMQYALTYERVPTS